MTRPNFIEMTRWFQASPQEVFDAWADPAVAGQWLFTSVGSERHEIEMDVRVGGKWRILDRRDGVDYTAIGEYLEVDPPRRLVMTCGMPQFAPTFDTLIIDIRPENGGTLMTLTQEGLAKEEEDHTRMGWTYMFNGLLVALPTPHSVTVTRELDAPPDAVYAAFTDLEIMRRWMGDAVEAAVHLGGTYRVRTDTPDGGFFVMTGVYWGLAPSRRILFTFYAGPSEDPEAGNPYTDQYVDIALRALPGGRTELTLRHAWSGEGHDPAGLEATKDGWNGWLDRLSNVVNQTLTGPPQP